MPSQPVSSSGLLVADPAPTRWIQLHGPLNFRDLGGYLTRDGGMVAWRHLFRSDSLHAATEGDQSTIVDGIGVRTIIDLRSGHESAAASAPARLVEDTDYRLVPILDHRAAPEPMAVPGVSIDEVYRVLLTSCGPRITTVLEVVAASPLPVVMHCGAGVDRTGLVAAVLLAVLGVSESDICRDYALSTAPLAEMLDRAGPGHDCTGQQVAVPPEARVAYAGTMRAALTTIRQDHGSVTGYVMDHGLDVDVIAELRATLIH